MDVHIVAEDPVRAAVIAAFEDVESVEAVDATPSDLEDARFAVVSDVVGAETFHRADDACRVGGTPWIAVEVGGVGGQPLAAVDAAVAGFSANTGWFDGLEARVDSHLDQAEVAAEPKAQRPVARLAGAIAGRECIRLFSGEEPTLMGQVRELPHARRQLLPTPGGAGSQPIDRDLDLADDERLDLEAAVDRVELAIDDRMGVVESIGEVESFPAPYYLATVADTTVYSDASAAKQAAGVAADWNEALMKATGEALERYCAGVYDDTSFLTASLEDGDLAVEQTVTPEDVVRPDDAPAFDPEAEARWVEGRNLVTGERTYIHADIVQFPQPSKTYDDGPAPVPAITTGLGLGSSTVDALSSGLTEVIERDATMCSWYSTFEPLEVTVSSERFDTLRRRARSEGLETTALLLTQDVDVPVVGVAVHRNLSDPTPDAEPWPHFAMGSAAGLDAGAAAVGALEEALQNWMELESLGPDDADQAGGAIGEYGAFPEAAREFVDADRTVAAASVGPESVPTGADRLAALLERVTDAGLTPSAARLTTRDVERLGFEAVRVVVPGAQPLFTGEPYFGERAETAPVDLGFEPRLDRAFHPYP